MEKISVETLKVIKRDIRFYDFCEMKSNDNSGLVLRFKLTFPTVRYVETEYPDAAELFENEKNKIIDFLTDFLTAAADTSCILIKYNDK